MNLAPRSRLMDKPEQPHEARGEQTLLGVPKPDQGPWPAQKSY